MKMTLKRRKGWRWLVLAGLLLAAAACAEGYQGYQAPYYPSYRYPTTYAPDYYGGPTYPYEDPEFWTNWSNSQGGG